MRINPKTFANREDTRGQQAWKLIRLLHTITKQFTSAARPTHPYKG
ncbi:hypothetical protein [Lysinibacillus fusiformis]|nr:hypothetical protein [Lysinibacillus fusiformis]